MIKWKQRQLEKKAHEEQRRDLWVSVAVAIAQSSNSTNKYVMEKWADHALAEFDARFKGAK